MYDDKEPLRVLLLAPDPAAVERAGRHLAQVGAPGAVVVDACFSESRALQQYFKLRPDVVVLDCRVVPEEPARFVGLLKRMAPGSCVVAVVPSPESPAAGAARRLGADHVGCLEALPAMIDALVLAS